MKRTTTAKCDMDEKNETNRPTNPTKHPPSWSGAESKPPSARMGNTNGITEKMSRRHEGFSFHQSNNRAKNHRQEVQSGQTQKVHERRPKLNDSRENERKIITRGHP